MEFKGIRKIRDGQYLKNYELTYLNKSGKIKKYEMVSRRELKAAQDIGAVSSGVSIVGYQDGKLLLLKEFRMSINKSIYNLCAGMLEEGENLKDCISRELYEETGLRVRRYLDILPASYAAVGFSDTTTYTAFVETEGEIEDHTSDNEMIHAALYTKAEVRELMKSEQFSSRSQMAAYYFCNSGHTRMADKEREHGL